MYHTANIISSTKLSFSTSQDRTEKGLYINKERYFEELDAPKGKHIIWFDNAGHMIPFEEPIEYSKALIHRVLKETYESQQ